MPLPRRIAKETERLHDSSPPNIDFLPDPANPRYFRFVLHGPEGTVFEGGCFPFEVFLTQEYPMAPPKVRFCCKIYHPGIDRVGRVGLDILRCKWSPALQVRTVLLSLTQLFDDAALLGDDCGLFPEVVAAFKLDPVAAKRTTELWTRTYARPPSPQQTAEVACALAMSARLAAADMPFVIPPFALAAHYLYGEAKPSKGCAHQVA